MTLTLEPKYHRVHRFKIILAFQGGNMDAATTYDAWADYYDVTDTDRVPFISFYRSLVTDKIRSFLDLGCGTGSITSEVARRLLELSTDPAETRIVGVDESVAMLRQARLRQSRFEWILGDMRCPPVEGRFDLVISCFSALQFLLTDADLARAFAAVRGLLAADGAFAFDVYQPNPQYLQTPLRDHLARSVIDGQGRRLDLREDTRYDAASQVLTVDWRLVQQDNAGAAPLAQPRFHLRQYFPADLDRLLAAAGLAVRMRYGDFDRSAFTPQSKRQILVCGPS